MKQKLLDSPFFLPLLFWCTGLIIGNYLELPVYCIGVFPFFFAISCFKKLRLISVLILFFCLGFLRLELQEDLHNPKLNEIMQQYSRIQQKISGKIDSEVKEKNGLFSFILQLDSINNVEVKGRIRLSTAKQNLKYGDIVETVAVLHKIEKGSNPSVFDAEQYFFRRNIQAAGFTKDNPKILGNSANKFIEIIIKIRAGIIARIENRFPHHSGFVRAVTIGDKSEINELRHVLGRAGLSHLLAVSGLHVGLLSLVLFNLLNLFFKRRFSRLLLIFILIFYGFICGWPASVSRAVIMIAVFLISKIIQRKTITNNILFFSLILITAIQPYQLFSAGLQMSFTAVFVLLNFLPKIRLLRLEKKEMMLLSHSKKVLNYFFIICFSSLILNLFLAPITIFHFGQFGFNGILGNLLGIPLMAVILPLALLIIVLPPISWLIALYEAAFSLNMLIFDSWVKTVADLPLFFDFISLNLLQVMLLFIILIFCWFFLNNLKGKKRLIYFSVVLLCSILFYFSFAGNDALSKITFFDCGLGDLAMIETKEGKVIMIDTGPTQRTALHFERSALPYCRENGIKTIDQLFVTHAHNDHYGGLESVMNNLEVKQITVTDEFMASSVWQKYEEDIALEECAICEITDTISFFYQDLKLTIIHPDKEFSDDNINNNSIVIAADFGEFEILFTGDLELEGEEYVMQKYSKFLPADFLKVGHHGSKTASSCEFVSEVEPEFAFISTSLQNRFDFPHSKTISTFSYLNEKLFVSGRDGAVQVIVLEDKIIIKSFKSDKSYQKNL